MNLNFKLNFTIKANQGFNPLSKPYYSKQFVRAISSYTDRDQAHDPWIVLGEVYLS